MRVIVDEDLCLGCGICEGLAPEVFSMANEPFAIPRNTENEPEMVIKEAKYPIKQA